MADADPGSKNGDTLFAGLLTAYETLMGLCCVSALIYRGRVNGHQERVQKYSMPVPPLEAVLPLPPHFERGSLVSATEARDLLKPC